MRPFSTFHELWQSASYWDLAVSRKSVFVTYMLALATYMLDFVTYMLALVTYVLDFVTYMLIFGPFRVSPCHLR